MTKANAKRVRARIGDVFTVPVGPEHRVYGQIVDQAGPQKSGGPFQSPRGSVENGIGSGIELAGIVFDAKLRNGDWPIVANVPPVKINPPWFVLGHEGLENLRLENFDGSSQRLTRAAGAERHGHRNISYPMALQRASEAVHGLREWSSDLDFFRNLARELEGPD